MVTDILQPTHLIFVLVIALLVLGPKRLPEVGRSLGRGLRDFRGALSGEEPERHEEIQHEAPVASPAPVASEPLAAEPVAEPTAADPAPAAEPPAPEAAPEVAADEPTRTQERVGQP